MTDVKRELSTRHWTAREWRREQPSSPARSEAVITHRPGTFSSGRAGEPTTALMAREHFLVTFTLTGGEGWPLPFRDLQPRSSQHPQPPQHQLGRIRGQTYEPCLLPGSPGDAEAPKSSASQRDSSQTAAPGRPVEATLLTGTSWEVGTQCKEPHSQASLNPSSCLGTLFRF